MLQCYSNSGNIIKLGTNSGANPGENVTKRIQEPGGLISVA